MRFAEQTLGVVEAGSALDSEHLLDQTGVFQENFRISALLEILLFRAGVEVGVGGRLGDLHDGLHPTHVAAVDEVLLHEQRRAHLAHRPRGLFILH